MNNSFMSMMLFNILCAMKITNHENLEPALIPMTLGWMEKEKNYIDKRENTNSLPKKKKLWNIDSITTQSSSQGI